MVKTKQTPDQKIIKLLRSHDHLPSTEIASITGLNYYQTINSLANLKRDNKVEVFDFRNRVYWRLKQKDPIQKMEESK